MTDFYQTARWRQLRKAVLERDGHACTVCGRKALPRKPLHVHHRIARSEGGPDSEDNLITACRTCHAREHPDVAIIQPASLKGPLVARAKVRKGVEVQSLCLPPHTDKEISDALRTLSDDELASLAMVFVQLDVVGKSGDALSVRTVLRRFIALVLVAVQGRIPPDTTTDYPPLALRTHMGKLGYSDWLKTYISFPER